MKETTFRFKTQLFSIGEFRNIPAHIICSGFGYAFETYCCKNCGELFIVNLEELHHLNMTVLMLIKDQECPKCKSTLTETLVKYPEHIYFKGQLLENPNHINRTQFDETYLLKTFEIT